MSKMSSFRDAWQRAKVAYPGDFETPEDGTYKCTIDGVRYSEVDKNGVPSDPQFVYSLTVCEGESTGCRFRKFSTVKSEKNLSYLKGDLATLGLAIPEDPENVIDVLKVSAGSVVEVTVKSRSYNGKTYKDCTFDKLVKRATEDLEVFDVGTDYVEMPY